MRQLTLDETAAVGGAVLDCGDLSVSLSLTGASISGSLNAWDRCLTSIADTINGRIASFDAGIPYALVHVA
jgi:hypothetical protein